MSLARTLRTARHLRAAQVGHRLGARLLAPWRGSALYARLALPSRDVAPPLRSPPGLWPGSAEEGRRILSGAIRLIGRERALAAPVDWRAAGEPLLWRFTLNYFEWLADLAAVGAEGAPLARALLTDWIARHEVPDAVAWHPYPLSLRLYAWLRSAPFLLAGADQAFQARFAAALDRQARHLARTLERDVGGNHLIKNLKALIAAGRCLGREYAPGAEAMLAGEVTRQVLADGAHFERSPSYHLQVLRDLIDVRALMAADAAAPAWLGEAIARMAPALAFFRHGDGGLALFNDGTVEDPHVVARALELAGGAAAVPDALAAAGYYRARAEDALVIMDAGRCCPDDLPAHAHADALSFELSVGAQRLVVNAGTYAYQDMHWRNRLRGTAAHSTVAVDDADSAEVYGAFRLGRRPRAVAGERRAEAGGVRLAGHHDGYRGLGLIHRRALLLGNDGRCLEGEDRLEPRGAVSARHAAARFHLHPDVAVTPAGADGARLALPGGQAWRFAAPGERVRVEDGVYAPRFYEMRATRQIVVDKECGASGCALAWELRAV